MAREKESMIIARIWLGGYHGKIVKWSGVAKDIEFVGVFGRLREGPYGCLTDLATPEGTLTFPVQWYWNASSRAAAPADADSEEVPF